jgi:aspartate racemase
MTKTIGILGGMGPEATVYFYDRLISKTKSFSDQEHIPVIIYSDPRIPPRTDAINKTGPSPVPFLTKGAKTLIKAGADFLVMPCITAHYFWPEVASVIDFPLVHLVEEAASWAVQKIPGGKKIGLISSSGTLNSGLFHKAFAQKGMEILSPEKEEQSEVMDCIFGPRGIKAGFKEGESKERIVRIARSLHANGAQAVIAGCTEIPLVLCPGDIPVPLIEPMAIGLESCIKKAGFEIRV